MKRILCVASLLLLAPLAGAQGDKIPSAKDIMKKLNGGPNCLNAYIGKDLQAEAPNWDEIQKETKEYAGLAAVLGKNTPSKGDKASWEKLTKAFADDAKALEQAAQNKDKKTAQTIYNKINTTSCKECHKVHRPTE